MGPKRSEKQEVDQRWRCIDGATELMALGGHGIRRAKSHRGPKFKCFRRKGGRTLSGMPLLRC